MTNFEAGGDLEDWPPNLPGKPTQVAVFGTHHTQRGKCCEIMWTGKFPDLDKAIYWGAKKEIEALRRRGYMMANRVVWQHDLSPEEAVATVYRRMEPQINHVMKTVNKGGDPNAAMLTGPDGPMKPVDHSKPQDYLVEIEFPEDSSANRPD